MNKRVLNSAVIYVVILMGIVVLKPKWFVDPATGQLKCFGIGPNETLFTGPLIALVIAMISYGVLLFTK